MNDQQTMHDCTHRESGDERGATGTRGEARFEFLWFFHTTTQMRVRDQVLVRDITGWGVCAATVGGVQIAWFGLTTPVVGFSGDVDVLIIGCSLLGIVVLAYSREGVGADWPRALQRSKYGTAGTFDHRQRRNRTSITSKADGSLRSSGRPRRLPVMPRSEQGR
jgi:hypothetical protein